MENNIDKELEEDIRACLNKLDEEQNIVIPVPEDRKPISVHYHTIDEEYILQIFELSFTFIDNILRFTIPANVYFIDMPHIEFEVTRTNTEYDRGN